jgi:hypothetical protein
MMADKDNYLIQRKRLERLINEMEPHGAVHWDESRSPHFLRLRVDHPKMRIVLVETSGDWPVSEIADKSDDQVRELIVRLSNNRIRSN